MTPSLLALHLQPIRFLSMDDYKYDEKLQVNFDIEGELACSRSSKPYTNAQTPGHIIKSGWTPSGKWKPSRSVPTKMDKRIGK